MPRFRALVALAAVAAVQALNLTVAPPAQVRVRERARPAPPRRRCAVTPRRAARAPRRGRGAGLARRRRRLAKLQRRLAECTPRSRQPSLRRCPALRAASQSGTLIDVQFLNPHAYGPNELFSQNWVYEGLVSYGADGSTLPALATAWTFADNGDGTTSVTFTLRQGVFFHDGQPWNAAACKTNFDNVFARALAATYHSWCVVPPPRHLLFPSAVSFSPPPPRRRPRTIVRLPLERRYDLPSKSISWSVAGEFTFVLRLSGPYYPALNEMTIIRPLRFLSPASFFTGDKENSCPTTRGINGNQTGAGTWVLCKGIKSPMGTGPWIFESKVTNMRVIGPSTVSFTPLNTSARETVSYVSFTANARYWGGAPAAARVITPANLNSSAVRAAMLAGTIDIAYGASLAPADFVALQSAGNLRTLTSAPLQTRVLVLNTNRNATMSLAVRQAINAALDRDALSRAVSSLEQPAVRLFSTDTQYANVDIGTLPTFSLDTANSLLANDGWAYASPSSAVRSKGGALLQLQGVYTITDLTHVALAPVIVRELASAGIALTMTGLSKAEYQNAGFGGNFEMILSETLGDPYDPASFVASWRTPRSYEWPAQLGLDGTGPTGATKAALDSDISAVLTELDDASRATEWQRILTVTNREALFAPLTYMCTRAVLQPNVAGFAFGPQQFDVPLNSVTMAAPSSGAASGLSAGAIAGIAVGSVAVVALAAGLLVARARGMLCASKDSSRTNPANALPPRDY